MAAPVSHLAHAVVPRAIQGLLDALHRRDEDILRPGLDLLQRAGVQLPQIRPVFLEHRIGNTFVVILEVVMFPLSQ